MSFRTSVCPNTMFVRPPKFVPMLSTPLFSIRMICQTYLWIPYVQAEVLRPIWFKSILKFENSVCLAVYLSICLFVCKKLFVHLCSSVCLFVCPKLFFHLCLSVRLNICLSKILRPPQFVCLFDLKLNYFHTCTTRRASKGRRSRPICETIEIYYPLLYKILERDFVPFHKNLLVEQKMTT